VLVRSRSSVRRVLIGVFVLTLVHATRLHAQSILDAQRVQFTPSADNNTLGGDGTPVVSNYTLTIYVAGGSTPFATANLGKPTPDADGMMRVDFSTLLSTPLQVGVSYEAVVAAVGPSGSGSSARSNTVELTTACTATLSGSSQNVGAAVTTGSVGVTSGCGWAGVSGASWLTITSAATGTGNGTLSFSVGANSATSPRSGTITIAGNTFTVNQAGVSCSTSLSSTSQTAVPGGGTGAVTVTAPAGCAWTAASNNTAWLTVTSGNSGNGSGTVSFSDTPNTGAASRTGTLLIGGVTFTVTQSACGYTVTPASLSVGTVATTGTLSLTTTAGCTWTASSSASWITVTPSGTGSATISYSASANPSASRIATLTIAGTPVSVLQTGLPPVSPSNLRIIR
jgi:hypothetical protein